MTIKGKLKGKVPGNVKLLHDVQFVPSIADNMLSVGQLMISGYSMVFDTGFVLLIIRKWASL